MSRLDDHLREHQARAAAEDRERAQAEESERVMRQAALASLPSAERELADDIKRFLRAMRRAGIKGNGTYQSVWNPRPVHVLARSERRRSDVDGNWSGSDRSGVGLKGNGRLVWLDDTYGPHYKVANAPKYPWIVSVDGLVATMARLLAEARVTLR